MLFLLSPAKALDYETPGATATHTLPQFRSNAAELIEILREKTLSEVASLMKLSDKLAALNVARYHAWSSRFTSKNSKPAVLAFNGDVYDGLDAQSLKGQDLDWAQQHVAILSGLYGILRPLDWMQPYRLEMGTKLRNSKGADLYAYWQDVVTSELEKRLQQEKTPVLVNLASQEYFKVVNVKALKAHVIHCVFEEKKGRQYKIVSFYAKRARGLMARYAIEKRANVPQVLQGFDKEGYVYTPSVSTPDTLVFRRG